MCRGVGALSKPILASFWGYRNALSHAARISSLSSLIPCKVMPTVEEAFCDANSARTHLIYFHLHMIGWFLAAEELNIVLRLKEQAQTGC